MKKISDHVCCGCGEKKFHQKKEDGTLNDIRKKKLALIKKLMESVPMRAVESEAYSSLRHLEFVALFGAYFFLSIIFCGCLCLVLYIYLAAIINSIFT